jgi:hypothetical protein
MKGVPVAALPGDWQGGTMQRIEDVLRAERERDQAYPVQPVAGDGGYGHTGSIDRPVPPGEVGAEWRPHRLDHGRDPGQLRDGRPLTACRSFRPPLSGWRVATRHTVKRFERRGIDGPDTRHPSRWRSARRDRQDRGARTFPTTASPPWSRSPAAPARSCLPFTASAPRRSAYLGEALATHGLSYRDD